MNKIHIPLMIKKASLLKETYHWPDKETRTWMKRELGLGSIKGSLIPAGAAASYIAYSELGEKAKRDQLPFSNRGIAKTYGKSRRALNSILDSVSV